MDRALDCPHHLSMWKSEKSSGQFMSIIDSFLNSVVQAENNIEKHDEQCLDALGL